MTAYYPSQAGYPVSQSVGMPMAPVGMPMTPVGMPMGQPYGMAASYAPAGGAIGYGGPTVVSGVPTALGAPVIMQPSYNGGYGYNHYSWGNRLRRFLGLAPNANVRYKNDRSTWGFMGYSRRQRYIDARTGGEVDRRGNAVYRI